MVVCDWSATLDHVTTLRVAFASTRRILLKASFRQNSVRLVQCPLDRTHRRASETAVVYETEVGILNESPNVNRCAWDD